MAGFEVITEGLKSRNISKGRRRAKLPLETKLQTSSIHTSMEDLPVKAAALAWFVDKHQDRFGRIDLIVVDRVGKRDERVKRLNWMNQKTRKKVMGVSPPQHLRDLFDCES